MEPEVLLRLAKSPPADAAALADVPGVGAALTERLGGTILRALGTGCPAAAEVEENPVLTSLERWRGAIAETMGLPAYAVIPDGVLHAIASAQPRNRLDLARIRGVGPRTLAKFGKVLLGIVAFSGGPSAGSASPKEAPELSEGSLLAKDEHVVVAVELDQAAVGDLVHKPLMPSG